MPHLIVRPVFDPSVRGLCRLPYEGHPRGCPNFAAAERCPPRAPLLPDVFDVASPFYAVYSVFPLGDHVRKMAEKHPDWSPRQQACVLYWQGTARKKLREEISIFLVKHPFPEAPGVAWRVEETPEALGVDVTGTMRAVDVVLPWPPREFAYHVALVGSPRPPR